MDQPNNIKSNPALIKLKKGVVIIIIRQVILLK